MNYCSPNITMTETLSLKEDTLKVYEIGYLLVSSIPAEKVADSAAYLKEVLSKKGAVMIAEESPELRELAYTMIKKIGTSNHRFDQGYFGWFKFELPTKEIESVKKELEAHPEMLRMLVITTVKENTYLGKKAPVAAPASAPVEGVVAEVPVAPVSVEEMDKSIDEMVKEA
ncbi:MAG: 30S ribosomal protein S6 [bacterium]|nr:30S ribosomal protein S6 [bacterium]